MDIAVVAVAVVVFDIFVVAAAAAVTIVTKKLNPKPKPKTQNPKIVVVKPSQGFGARSSRDCRTSQNRQPMEIVEKT